MITVTVSPTPVTAFTVNANRQCQNNNQFLFKSSSSNLLNSVYTWDFGDGIVQSSPTDSVVTHVYAASGNFAVKLNVLNPPKCAVEKSLTITVVPKPLALFNYPAIVCEKQTPVVFTNISSVPGGVSTLTKWWWSINKVVTTIQTPASFIANTPGTITVQLVVTTNEGCRSDTNTTVIPVRYRPVSAFSYAYPRCDNELLKFTDRSVMPQNAPPKK